MKLAGDIGIHLKKSIQRKAVLVIIKLAAGASGQEHKSPMPGHGEAGLRRKLMRSYLRQLQSDQPSVSRKTGHLSIYKLVTGAQVNSPDSPFNVRFNPARASAAEILAPAGDRIQRDICYGIDNVSPKNGSAGFELSAEGVLTEAGFGSRRSLRF